MPFTRSESVFSNMSVLVYVVDWLYCYGLMKHVLDEMQIYLELLKC